jgi:hypothetical protein
MSRTRFSSNSRYFDVETTTTVAADGRDIVHLRRRFAPQPDALSTIGRHVVAEGERIDNVAAAEVGDATAWWQLADANGANDPEELVEQPGTVLRVTLPAEFGPGASSV